MGYPKKYWLLPVIGCLCFVVLYVVASLYYPGGNYEDKNFKGFSWAHNYWCNLLGDSAINGRPNGARPFAFAAMAVLVGSLVLFWYLFPGFAGFEKKIRYMLQTSGVLAMLISAFIFTPLHDVLINIAGAFGLIALGGTMWGLKKLNWNGLYYMGFLIVILILLNNFLYYRSDPRHWLAVVQKISFALFLVWIGWVSLRCFVRDPQAG